MSRVGRAFAEVPREDFLPEDQRGCSDQDRALRIGHRQTNSQPTTVRAMLELLDVDPGHRVLDVGSGSGWTTALLGELVGPTGEVYGVEIVPELVTFGRANLARRPRGWTHLTQAFDDVLGLPNLAPFDRILVSAEAGRVPEALVDQLVPDGLLVLPVAGAMTSVRRTRDGPVVRRHGHYSFVPLIEPRSRDG